MMIPLIPRSPSLLLLVSLPIFASLLTAAALVPTDPASVDESRINPRLRMVLASNPALQAPNPYGPGHWTSAWRNTVS